MRADSNCTHRAKSIAAMRAGSREMRNLRLFSRAYGSVRLPKIICLKWFFRLDPRYTSPYLGRIQVATGELIVLIRIRRTNVLPAA